MNEISLRPLRPGDLGWVISRHGEIYAQEYGWDWRFEAMVAEIAARFVQQFDAAREAGWIADRVIDGKSERLGCIFLVQARSEAGEIEPGVAQLRMLLIEAQARGLGLGKRLVATCTAFARETGYRKIRLWTNQQLDAARGIYTREGYRLVASEPFSGFGHEHVGETWELDL